MSSRLQFIQSSSEYATFPPCQDIFSGHALHRPGAGKFNLRDSEEATHRERPRCCLEDNRGPSPLTGEETPRPLAVRSFENADTVRLVCIGACRQNHDGSPPPCQSQRRLIYKTGRIAPPAEFAPAASVLLYWDPIAIGFTGRPITSPWRSAMRLNAFRSESPCSV